MILAMWLSRQPCGCVASYVAVSPAMQAVIGPICAVPVGPSWNCLCLYDLYYNLVIKVKQIRYRYAISYFVL